MVSLGSYNYKAFDRGCSFLVRLMWMLLGRPFVRTPLQPFSSLRVFVLRRFGARIGSGVCIKAGVRVTAPWRLSVGNNCWIGEDCWIDNLGQITIDHDACLSQGVYLVTGNHDWSDPAFGILVKPIRIGEGAWVGAKSIVTAGVTIGACGIATAGSVVTKHIGEHEIWAGNPANLLKRRQIRSLPSQKEIVRQPELREKTRVLVVGPSPEAKGGIASVISAQMQSRIWEEFHCQLVSTYLREDGRWKKLAFTLRAYLQCACKMPFVDMLHVHLAGQSSLLRKVPVIACSRFWRKPVIVHVHAYSPESLFEKTPAWAVNYVLTNADRIVALSDQWRSAIKERVPAGRISVIHNPAVMPDLSAGIDSRPPVVLFLGKLETRKGTNDLLQSARIVLQTCPEAKFILAGIGDVAQADALSKDLGIRESVCFPGWVSRKALPGLLEQTAVFCLPSYAEGVPMAVLEAMSAGIPVITTPVGGIPDFIQHGISGLLVQPGDIASLARELACVLENRMQLRSRLGAAGRTVVTERCSLHKMEQDLESLYREVLGLPSGHCDQTPAPLAARAEVTVS